MSKLFKNLRFAWRQMRRSPGFAITAILTLALGIGATTAIYTVVYATLLAPMPYPKPNQLVMVWSQFGSSTHNSVSSADYLDWKQLGERTHEIGVRMALGADRSHVVTMVLREALILACTGLAIGLVGAWLVERAMQSTLYGIGSIDFSALAAVSAILLAATFLAGYIPARRASRVDPMRALRID
jgi:predicted lysophospholipase L1 biosynthesis ABC-type transport system permease subunit